MRGFNYNTAPTQLTEGERASLNALRSFQSMGSMSSSARQQLMSLEAKEQTSIKYATSERRRIAQESRSAATEQAKQTQIASQQQIDAANLMQKTYVKQQEQVREDLAPWRQAGAKAVGDLQGEIDAGPGEYEKSPGYQFAIDEGQKGITNRASQHGNVLSGATMKAATKFGQDYATKDYDKFLDRYYNSLQPKQNLAQMGQASAAQVASQGLQTTNLMGQSQQYSGEAAAGGTMGAANIMAAQSAAAGERDYSYTAWKTGREF